MNASEKKLVAYEILAGLHDHRCWDDQWLGWWSEFLPDDTPCREEDDSAQSYVSRLQRLVKFAAARYLAQL